jgi:3-oxoacyl-[acyl-carrier-protein] synthase III
MAEKFLAAILGTGSAVPAKVLSNADLEKTLDTSDEWIVQRTGIRQRRISQNGETTASLAVEAGRKALEASGVAAGELDLIVCATVTPDMIFPSVACFVQEALGVKDVPAFDLSAACSGFLYGLATGSAFVEAGRYKKVLVIGADTLSKMCDYTDRGSCILFGDAAGAVVLEPNSHNGRGVLYTVLCADGGGWNYIHVPAGGSRTPNTHATLDAGDNFVKMRGRDVYKFAVEKMQWLLGECLSKCGLTVADVDLLVPHQVNIRIIESAAQKYGFPMEKVFLNIERYGNTSAASIPLALDEAVRSGRAKPGSTIILVAFGAGLTWAGSVVRL